MNSDLEFFVSDESGERGPLGLDALRDELRERCSSDTLVRVGAGGAFIPAFAWDAAGDLGIPPAPVPPPEGGPAMTLPPAIAALGPSIRDQLLWFVSDKDGIMGPVTGELVRKWLSNGKLPVSAGICLVSAKDWVRASIVFPPRPGESPTAIRPRPLTLAPCAFCLEPMPLLHEECEACGEPVLQKRALGRGRAALAGAVAILAMAGLAFGAAFGLRGRAPLLLSTRPSAPLSSAAPPDTSASLALVSASPRASRSAAPPDTSAAAAITLPAPPADATHIEGRVDATIALSADASVVLPLSGHRVAVGRRAALDVIDGKTGSPTFTAPDLPGLRALHWAGKRIYGRSSSRIAVIDPENVRALRWIEQSGELSVAPSGIALALLEPERAAAVLDTERHAEIERFRFDERITSIAVDPRATVAVLTTADPRRPRASGDDAIFVFDPRKLAASQPLRRIHAGAGAAAAALAPKGSHAAVALQRANQIARVELGPLPIVTREQSCADPVLLRFASPPSGTDNPLLLVACRAGRALAIHDGITFAPIATLDLGGAALDLAVSPDGRQALVAVGRPLPGLAIIDLAARTLRRTEIRAELTRVGYAPLGDMATAFSPRARRLWVLQ